MQQGEKAQGQQKQQKPSPPPLPPLHAACWRGDSAAVQRLLASGADPNAVGASGARPLHLAARAGHASVVKQLLEAGAEVDARDGGLFTALHAACEHGHADCARELAAAGANLNAGGKRTRRTPALLAAMEGHWDLVCELGRLGADLNRMFKHDNIHVLHVLASELRERDFPPEGPQLLRDLLAAGASARAAVFPPIIGPDLEDLGKLGAAPTPIDMLLGYDGLCMSAGPAQEILELPAGTSVPELIRLLSEDGCPVDKMLVCPDSCCYGSTLHFFQPPWEKFVYTGAPHPWPEGSGAAEVRAALEEAARREEAHESKKRKAPDESELP